MAQPPPPLLKMSAEDAQTAHEMAVTFLSSGAFDQKPDPAGPAVHQLSEEAADVELWNRADAIVHEAAIERSGYRGSKNHILPNSVARARVFYIGGTKDLENKDRRTHYVYVALRRNASAPPSAGDVLGVAVHFRDTKVKTYVLSVLAVAPAARRAGVATALVKHFFYTAGPAIVREQDWRLALEHMTYAAAQCLVAAGVAMWRPDHESVEAWQENLAFCALVPNQVWPYDVYVTAEDYDAGITQLADDMAIKMGVPDKRVVLATNMKVLEDLVRYGVPLELAVLYKTRMLKVALANSAYSV